MIALLRLMGRSKITQIVFLGNLNHTIATRYLSEMEDQGLIRHIGDGWEATEEGLEFELSYIQTCSLTRSSHTQADFHRENALEAFKVHTGHLNRVPEFSRSRVLRNA